MNIFKSFCFTKKKDINLISNSFGLVVREIINEIDCRNSEISDDEFYEIISKRRISDFEVKEIYVFLPIVFARLWIRDIKWDEMYIELLPNKKEMTKRFAETLSFQIIFEIVKEYFEKTPSSNTIIQIGGRSAEMNAVNELLLDGGEIGDVKVTRIIIMR